MITLVTGYPGSGKSYYAVWYIWHYFIRDNSAHHTFMSKHFLKLAKHFKKKNLFKLYRFLRKIRKYFVEKRQPSKDYDVCLNNLNDFNFRKIRELQYNKDKQHLLLNINLLDVQIRDLHKQYLTQEGDDALNDLAKEFGLYKALIILDECQDIFESRKKHLQWWLSYHRHMYQDILLFSQNVALIDSKYKAIIQQFFKAVPSSMLIFGNKFKYNQYSNARFSANAKIPNATVSLSKLDIVFSLYKSGDSVKTSNILFKMGSMIFLLMVFLFIIYKAILFFQFNEPIIKDDVVEKVNHYKNESVTLQHEEFISSDDVKQIYMTIFCSDDYCIIDNYQMPISVFSRVTRDFDLEIIEKSTMLLGFYKLHVMINPSYKNILPQNQSQSKDISNPDQGDSTSLLGELKLF